MQPIAVTSGLEALALLDGGATFDIAILDMQMPEMDGFTLASRIGEILLHPFPLIILTSINRDKTRTGDAKISAFLNKPIKPSSLYNWLMDVLIGNAVVKVEPKKVQSIDSDMGKRHPLRILLAEDNLINQKAAIGILKRLGYHADIAANGLEAIEALERQAYDVVLMDIQMPEMDGDEATKCIRERWSQEHQPYIIAMTANALEGDREKYIAKDMDDYVSKPVRLEELIRALESANRLGQ